ncbi:hypothetical protein ACA910_006046 [Epithemia clementina (nom. ined.)]
MKRRRWRQGGGDNDDKGIVRNRRRQQSRILHPLHQAKQQLERQDQASDDCKLDTAGNYGVLADTSAKYPSYFYQVVYNNSDGAGAPSFRKAIINGILPSLFVCPGVENRTAILGISSIFQDRVSPFPCLIDQNDGETCVTFESRPFLWTNSGITLEEAQAILRPLIHSLLYFDTQELLAQDNRTKRIEYIEEENDQLFRPPPPDVLSNVPSFSSSPPPASTPAPSRAPVSEPAPVAGPTARPSTTSPTTKVPTKTPTTTSSVPSATPSLSLLPSTSLEPSSAPIVAIEETLLPTRSPMANNSNGVLQDKSNNDDDGSSSSWWLWLAIGGGALVLALCGVFFFCWSKNCSGGSGEGQQADELSSANTPEKTNVSRRNLRKSGSRKQPSLKKQPLDDNSVPADARSLEYVPPGDDIFPESAPMKFSVDDSGDDQQPQNGGFVRMAHTVFNQAPEEDELTGEMGTEAGEEEEGAHYDEEGGAMEYGDDEYDDGEDGEVEYDEHGNEIHYIDGDEDGEEDDDEYTNYMEDNVLDNIQGDMLHDYMNDDEVDADIVGDMDSNIEEGDEAARGEEYDEDGEDGEEGDEYDDGDEEDGDNGGGRYRDGFDPADYVEGGYDGIDPSDEGDDYDDGEEDDEEYSEEYIDETIHEETTAAEEDEGGVHGWRS